MTTECSDKQMEFKAMGRRCVRASFDGGRISSDGGGLLLREVERHTRIIERLAGCFTDHRDAGRLVVHEKWDNFDAFAPSPLAFQPGNAFMLTFRLIRRRPAMTVSDNRQHHIRFVHFFETLGKRWVATGGPVAAVNRHPIESLDGFLRRLAEVLEILQSGGYEHLGYLCGCHSSPPEKTGCRDTAFGVAEWRG